MLGLALALFLAALPALPILVLLRRLDRARPEPLGLVGKSVLYGFVAIAPAALIEALLSWLLPSFPGIPGRFLEAFVVAALVEEGIKFVFVRRYLWKRREFDEAADGIVYAASLSLGFAIVENFLFTWNDPGLLILRSVTAVPLHAIATGFMGYWFGVEKLASLNKTSTVEALRAEVATGRLPLRALGSAVAFHGLYDFCLLEGGLLSFLVFPLLVVGVLLLKRRFDAAKRLDDLVSAAAARPFAGLR
jgi:RsiW-degrading membrane proteinase PrsW (M82 family)